MKLRIVKVGDKYRIQSKSWRTLWIWRTYMFQSFGGEWFPNEFESLEYAQAEVDRLKEMFCK